MAKENRISLRLATMEPRVRAAAMKSRLSVADWIRECIARELGVKAPKLCSGNPDFGNPEIGRSGAEARWGIVTKQGRKKAAAKPKQGRKKAAAKPKK